MTAPLLEAAGLTKWYGDRLGCRDVGFDIREGEVLAIVGESGSGKSTLLSLLSGQLAPTSGSVAYRMRDGSIRGLVSLSEAERRYLFRTDWGFVHQDAAKGLRMGVSAGGNVGERLMAVGARHYGDIRAKAEDWLERVEIDVGRIDEKPTAYSGGMRQRLQIARNLVTAPRLVFATSRQITPPLVSSVASSASFSSRTSAIDNLRLTDRRGASRTSETSQCPDCASKAIWRAQARQASAACVDAPRIK